MIILTCRQVLLDDFRDLDYSDNIQPVPQRSRFDNDYQDSTLIPHASHERQSYSSQANVPRQTYVDLQHTMRNPFAQGPQPAQSARRDLRKLAWDSSDSPKPVANEMSGHTQGFPLPPVTTLLPAIEPQSRATESASEQRKFKFIAESLTAIEKFSKALDKTPGPMQRRRST